jgi:hypothetical protein
MFGSGFTLGFTLSDVTAQVSGFLGNPVIVGLIAVSLALVVIPRIVHAAKSALDPYSDPNYTDAVSRAQYNEGLHDEDQI